MIRGGKKLCAGYLNSRGPRAPCRDVLLASAGLILVHRLLLLGYGGCTVHLAALGPRRLRQCMWQPESPRLAPCGSK